MKPILNVNLNSCETEWRNNVILWQRKALPFVLITSVIMSISVSFLAKAYTGEPYIESSLTATFFFGLVVGVLIALPPLLFTYPKRTEVESVNKETNSHNTLGIR